MSERQIENDDRGFTVSKSLAWTMVVGLVLFGVAAGQVMGTLVTKIDNMAVTIQELGDERISFRSEVREELAQIERRFDSNLDRLRTLERSEASDRARIAEIGRTLNRIDSKLEDLTSRLRNEESAP